MTFHEGNRFEVWFWKIAEIITFPVWGILTVPISIIAILSVTIDSGKLTEDEERKRSKSVQRITVQASLWIMGFAAAKFVGWV